MEKIYNSSVKRLSAFFCLSFVATGEKEEKAKREKKIKKRDTKMQVQETLNSEPAP